MNLKPGDMAPDFSLLDQNGQTRHIKDFSGKYLLLYFYPRDFTPGCTKEACNFRDAFPRFNSQEFTVVGISTDTVDSHLKFARKYQLPFTLLSDVDKVTVNDYGVWQPKKFMGREFLGTVRTSFLLDPKGKIVKIYPKVNPLNHSSEVETDIKSLTTI